MAGIKDPHHRRPAGQRRGRRHVLEAARAAGRRDPDLCHLEGLYDVGACRLCLVEVAGVPQAAARLHHPRRRGHGGATDTERLRKYRRMILELLFAERNHVCASASPTATASCRTWPYRGHGPRPLPLPLPEARGGRLPPAFGMDHNRCILCTRCVRVCGRSRAPAPRDVAGRGGQATSSPTSTSPGARPRPAPLRQVRAGLPDRRPVPQGRHRRRDGTRPRLPRHRHRTREKKQWIAHVSQARHRLASAAAPAATCRSSTSTSSSSTSPRRSRWSTARSSTSRSTPRTWTSPGRGRGGNEDNLELAHKVRARTKAS
jgi:ferredoxin